MPVKTSTIADALCPLLAAPVLAAPADRLVFLYKLGKQPIDRIAFDLESGSMHGLVTDTGSLAPGSMVGHAVMAGILPDTFAPATCA